MVELEKRASLYQWQEIRLKTWGIRPDMHEFGLRAQERLEDFKQSNEMLRCAFLKDPIPVWRKVGRVRQTRSTVPAGPV